MWPWDLTSPMTLTLDFKVKFWNRCISGMGEQMEQNVWVGRMLDPLCALELWPHSWPSHWMFGYSSSCFVGFQEGMVGLIWIERDMNWQHNAYSIWPWLLTLPMALTWIFQGENLKTKSQKSQILLQCRSKNFIFHMLHKVVVDASMVTLEM